MNDTGFPSPPAVPNPTPRAVPQTFGQLMDRVFRLMRTHWKVFFQIASVPAGVMIVLYAVMIASMLLIVQPWHHPNPVTMSIRMICFMAAWFAIYLLFMLVFAIFLAAGVFAALQVNAGAPVTMRQAYAKAMHKAGRYIWLMILCCVMIVGPIMVLAVVAGGGMILAFAHGGNPSSGQLLLIPLIIVFYIVVMIYGVLMGLWLALACPACIAEDLTAWAAIRRSFRLTQGAKGRIFLLLLVIYALVYAGMMVVEIALGIVGSLVFLVGLLLHLALNPWGFIGIGVAAILLLAAMFAMMALSWGGYSTTFAVVYHDQRLRKDGVGAAPVPVS